jgi:hypothetical protein
VGWAREFVEDLANWGVFRKKEEPDRIGDEVYEATKIFTYINLDGTLQSGLGSHGPLIYTIL